MKTKKNVKIKTTEKFHEIEVADNKIFIILYNSRRNFEGIS